VSGSRDFWPACGHHLLDRDAAARLLVTDEFLKAYLARPELVPPPEACAVERQLHQALLRDPRQSVAATQLAAIDDTDARENWEMMMVWRDHLVKHRTLEAAYLEIIRRNIKFPHVLIGQLLQAILRNILDDCDDVLVLRAAEIFRPQKLLVQGFAGRGRRRNGGVAGPGSRVAIGCVARIACDRRGQHARRCNRGCLLGTERPL
jgi:hypothetical protein